MKNDYIYDLETYPNVFTMSVEHAWMPFHWFFEISDWQNDSEEIYQFLMALKLQGARMIGFNNLGFDYPIIHLLLKMRNATSQVLFDKAQAIIQSQDNDRWAHQVYPSDRYVEQIDLYKIHHFDNKAKTTSLKLLEFNMRSDNVEDLPFPVGMILNEQQAQVLRIYNMHDVSETKKFYHHTLPMIKLREELSQKYERDFMNHNDPKIGSTIFEIALEKAGVQLYDYGTDGRKPRQTKRPQIALKDAILPWVQFEQPEFNRVLNWLKQQTITETKGVFKDLIANINGFEFVFGLGGIHGSVDSEVIESDPEHMIIDLDVSSYYPNLAISNRFYPEHLGEAFCDVYQQMYEQRKKYAKGSPENAAYKLALNGTYGKSNEVFSVFYDPLFTMRITLNGQLLLCLLAEQLIKIPSLRLVQLNTDGLTIHVNRDYKLMVDTVRHWWEQQTKLQLEEALYSRMFIRDVNNYIAEYENGDIKLKGAYDYNLGWHQNASALVIPKVAEQVLLHDKNIREVVESWPDVMDFMLRTKVPRSSKLMLQDEHGVDHQIQNVSRYYIAKGGGKLFKMMPPTPKQVSEGKTDWRRIGIDAGWGVQVCNKISEQYLPIDYEYYIQEVEKLVLGLA